MKVFVRIKSLKKRKSTELRSYELSEGIGTVRGLIAAFVHAELPLLALMSAEEIDDNAKAGKVAFGRLWSDNKADEAKAVEAAFAAFGDGLFRVLMDDEELKELDHPVKITEGTVFTFIRLTFLAGRMW